MKSREDLSNKGVNGLDSTKVALNDLNGQFKASWNLVNDMIPVLESTNKVLADVNSDKNLNGTISKLNKAKDGLQKGMELTDKGIDAINKGQNQQLMLLKVLIKCLKVFRAKLVTF